MIESAEGGVETERDAPCAWSADDLHALAEIIAGLDPAVLPVPPVDLLDQLDALARIKSAAAAAQPLSR